MGAPFIPQSRPPDVVFEPRSITPPGAIYVSKDDFLQVEHRGSVVGGAFWVVGRLLLPNSEINPFAFQLFPSSNRTVGRTNIQLPEGHLISVAVSDFAGFYNRGQLHVSVHLVRTRETGFTSPSHVLIFGYPNFVRSFSWPPGFNEEFIAGHGFLRSITGTNPALGVEISETVPANAQWLLYGVTFVLVTGATVATRSPHLIIDDGTNILYDIIPTAGQGASNTFRYSAFHAPGAANAFDGTILLLLPGKIMLGPGYRIRTATSTFQTLEDNYGAPQIHVEEWIVF